MKKITLSLILIAFIQSLVFSQPGSVDLNFNVGSGFGPDEWTGKCEVVAQQSDGKLLVGGSYLTFNGDTSLYIVRLNLDGTRDQSFESPFVAPGWQFAVTSIIPLSDGKIIISGSFNQTASPAIKGIARLNSNGSVDASFTPASSLGENINQVTLQNDGKLVLNTLQRLNADGSIDNTFSKGTGIAGTTGFGGVRINTLKALPNGKIIIGGHFASYNGVNRKLLAMLNSDGSLDAAFDASANFSADFSGFYGQVYSIVPTSDGKFLIGGNYGNNMGGRAFGVDRINADGSIDTTFKITHSFSNIRNVALAMQNDGKVLAANVNFGAPSEAFVLERYLSNGSLDTILPKIFFNRDVRSVFLQNDGKILVAGHFKFNPIGIVRFMNDATTGLTSNIAFESISIYPNPASEKLNIAGIGKKSEVKIMNMAGKLVYTSFSDSNESLTIDTDVLGKGIFYIAISGLNQTILKKVVIY